MSCHSDCKRYGCMIKAVFFDIDGTLYSHTQRKVPDSTIRALRMLREKGIRLVVSTGRHPQELHVLPEMLPFDAYLLMNGQLCLDEKKNAFFEDPLSGDLQKELLDFYRMKKFPAVLISRERLIVNFLNEQAAALSHLTDAAVFEGEPRADEAFFMASVVADAASEDRLRECLEGFKIVRWHMYGVDVIPPEAGKVRGIRKYLEMSGIRREETMAFGDAENDLEMLRFAQISVCMGNGSAPAREASGYVTDGIDEDGLFHALRHFELI